jgi:hypothetical protein
MLDCLRKKNNFDFKELLSADAIIFLKIIYFFLCPQKVEKTTLKSCSEILKFLSALLPLAAQTEEFMFQNVAYRPTVYKTGGKVLTWFNGIIGLLLFGWRGGTLRFDFKTNTIIV